MAMVNKKILKQIKEQILITDIADEYGFTVITKSGKLSLKEHESVLIYPETNSFYRYSTGVGGDVLKFMEAFPDEPNMAEITFLKAYNMLATRIDKSMDVNSKKEAVVDMQDKYKTYKNSLYPKQQRAKNLKQQFRFDDNCRNVMAYLIQTRKIDPGIVKKLINENCIKQETAYLFKNKKTGELVKKKPENAPEFDMVERKSVVFLGYDEHGMVASACKRACSTSSTFKGEYPGSDYSYGWLHDPCVVACNAYAQNQSYDFNKQLFCFESYIDMISFMSLLKMQNSDYTKYAYLSCGSATKYPTVLATQEHYGYKNVTICFDNDEAGHKFSDRLKTELENKGVTVSLCISKEKDWNNELKLKVDMYEEKSIKSNILKAKLKQKSVINKSGKLINKTPER